MKNIRIFIWKLSVFGGEIFNIFDEACFHKGTGWYEDFLLVTQAQMRLLFLKKQNKEKKKRKEKKNPKPPPPPPKKKKKQQQKNNNNNKQTKKTHTKKKHVLWLLKIDLISLIIWLHHLPPHPTPTQTHTPVNKPLYNRVSRKSRNKQYFFHK